METGKQGKESLGSSVRPRPRWKISRTDALSALSAHTHHQSPTPHIYSIAFIGAESLQSAKLARRKEGEETKEEKGTNLVPMKRIEEENITEKGFSDSSRQKETGETPELGTWAPGRWERIRAQSESPIEQPRATERKRKRVDPKGDRGR